MFQVREHRSGLWLIQRLPDLSGAQRRKGLCSRCSACCQQPRHLDLVHRRLSGVRELCGEKDVWGLQQQRPRLLDLAPAVCSKEYLLFIIQL